MMVLFPLDMSEPEVLPSVAVSDLRSMTSSMIWKQSPSMSPHSDIVSTTSSDAPAMMAPVLAHISNMALVLPSIMDM